MFIVKGIQLDLSTLGRHKSNISLLWARSRLCAMYNFRVNFLSQVWWTGKWSPDNIQAFIPGICVTLYAKIDFASMINLRIFRRGDYSGLSEWVLNVITYIIIKEGKKRFHAHREGRVTMEGKD